VVRRKQSHAASGRYPVPITRCGHPADSFRCRPFGFASLTAYVLPRLSLVQRGTAGFAGRDNQRRQVYRHLLPGAIYCYRFQPSPLNSSTNHAFFSANSILLGITVTTLRAERIGNQNLLVLNDGALKTGETKSVGTDNFGDTLVLKFSPGCWRSRPTFLPVAKADRRRFRPMQPLSRSASTTVTHCLISTAFSEATGAFGFFGVSSATPITSIQILDATNEALTGVDNIAFSGS